MRSQLPALTVGVEEELFLVDANTGQLVDELPENLFTSIQASHPEQIVCEFLSSQIEIISKPHQTIAGLHQDLSQLRTTVIELLKPHGIAVIASSTHPMAHWTTQHRSANDRYERLETSLQAVARRMLVGGMHVHVGVENENDRLNLLNELCWYLPLLLLLSTSSPFWSGIDTGMSSYRLSVIDGLPRSGIPTHFASLATYQQYMKAMIDSGTIEDSREIWWDVRLNCKYPTVETRIMDICTDLDDAMAIAAFYQCLVRWLFRGGHRKPKTEELCYLLSHENRWRAQRYPIQQAKLINCEGTDLLNSRHILDELLKAFAEDAAALDCEKQLAHVQTILKRGTSADMQRQTYQQAIEQGATQQQAFQHVLMQLIDKTNPNKVSQ